MVKSKAGMVVVAAEKLLLLVASMSVVNTFTVFTSLEPAGFLILVNGFLAATFILTANGPALPNMFP